jgi:CheY-like chemotaxis protein
VIGNLLNNAAKFTPRGGRTTISLRRGDGDHAVLTVRDTGVGIGPEVLSRLFEPFVQSETTLDRSTGGLGLGLALVKGLVEQHRGDVAVHSDGVGRGATFVVRLPLERRQTPRLTLMPQAEGRFARRILLVEDNQDSANTLREAFEMNGHVVEVAFTGFDGIDKARAFRPDVILCDIGLPGMDGYEVARRIRADPLLRGIPLFALSGYAQPEDVERSREAGFDLHLAKPVDLDELEVRLSQARGASTAAS